MSGAPSQGGRAPAPAPSEQTSSNVSWLPVIFACLMIAVGQSGMGMLLPALPGLQDDMGLSVQQAQWLVSGYLLGFGPSQLLFGPLSDRYGRRPVLLAGLGLALAGILLALAGHASLTALLLGRLLQGMGAGCASVIARVSLRDRFEGPFLRQAMSYFATTMAFVPTIAPLFGGLLAQHYGWLSVFVCMAGYLLLLWVVIVCYFDECHPPQDQGLRVRDVAWQYLDLLHNKHFLCFAGIVWVQYGLNVLCISIMPFLMQRNVGMDAADYGHWTLLPALALIAGGFAASKSRHRLSESQQLLLACLLQGIAGLGLLILPLSAWGLMGCQALFTFANGMAFPSALSSLLEPFKKTAGTATALAGAGQMLVASLGTAWLVSLGVNSPSALGHCLLLGALLLVLLAGLGRKAVPAADEWHGMPSHS